mmetsp:Transcript_9594/g.26090  ORF Transcript_9594/g.26090 Transcript_9594/m.26090 type:complete len:274 (-) Transcript_9594:321-1142(-)
MAVPQSARLLLICCVALHAGRAALCDALAPGWHVMPSASTGSRPGSGAPPGANLRGKTEGQGQPWQQRRWQSRRIRRWPASAVGSTSVLFMKDGWFAPEEPEEGELVTREMLLRDMLEDPVVRKKRKGKNKGGYRPLDNRDNLPFVIKQTTPDPYTHPEKKKAKVTKPPPLRRTDLDQHLTPSKLYEKDGDASTLLGEFKLDKSTTSGDVIIIGSHEFEVQKARCQYKYVGGKRFVMVRKILEVKEVARVAQEDFISQQFHQSDELDHPPKLT